MAFDTLVYRRIIGFDPANFGIPRKLEIAKFSILKLP